MHSKSLFALLVAALLASNLLTLYLSTKLSRETEESLEFTRIRESNPYPNSLAYIYGDDNIPFHKKSGKQTVQEYLKEKGLPTYELNDNYGDLSQVKLDENTQTIDTDPLVPYSLSSGKKPKTNAAELKARMDEHDQQVEILKADLKKSSKNKNIMFSLNESSSADAYLENNPYKKLGLYETMPKEYYNVGPSSVLRKKTKFYGILHNSQYCEQVDLYNLAHQDKVFNQLDFISDYDADENLIRKKVLTQFGRDTLPKLTALMPVNKFPEPKFNLPFDASMVVFKRVNVHHFYETNKQLVCFSQIYNHIPGHGVLTRKDLVVDAIKEYAANYTNKPYCIKDSYFPIAYRLNVAAECQEFFDVMNSEEFQKTKIEEPVQYIIKVGIGAHRASGLALLDDAERDELNKNYDFGRKCGVLKNSLVAQKYISNPLLLDRQNKFDFRIYMLIASVKPLIVYYHDGFLRLSLSKYEKNSTQKNVHFTNTHLSKEIFAEARKNSQYQGMTEGELRDYQMWMMEDLQDYLLKIGKIKNRKWIETELRPKFQQAFVHIARMVEHSFYKSSSVFELFGLDFVMDDNLDIWFIECNASPQLVGTNERKTQFLINMLTDMFEIQFAYFKSRMKRAFSFVGKFVEAAKKDSNIDYKKYQKEFDSKIDMNRLEPEFKISANNSFILLMDKNLKGPKAYFSNLQNDCVEF